MPDCDEALELISAQIDGALTQEEAAVLAAHLEHCPACRALLADLEQIHSDLEAIPPVSPPSGLQEDIMARIRAEQKSRPRVTVRWRSWAAMAAIFAVVLLGASTLRIWQDGGSGATYTAGGGAAPPTSASQAEQNDASTGADDGLTGEATPRGGGDAGVASQATTSPAPPDEAVSPENGSQGNASSPTTPSVSSPVPGQHDSSQSAGGGSQPKPAPSDTDTQPRTEIPSPSQTQIYTATPVPTPGVDVNITAADVPTYLGILTLTWEQAGELSDLEGLSFTTQGDTRTYVLPAGRFEALVQHLGEGAIVSREGKGISPDATEGLVLVTGVPESQP